MRKGGEARAAPEQPLTAETQALAAALRYVHDVLLRASAQAFESRAELAKLTLNSVKLSKQLRDVLESRPDLNVALRLDPSLSREIGE